MNFRDEKGGLTCERLKQLLHYDPLTGFFTWIDARSSTHLGERAGCLTNNGYVRIMVEGHEYRAHRLAWLYMTGNWPVRYIDHRDRDQINNIWDNLREATTGQNRANSKVVAASGFKGVYRSDNRWRACIRHNKKIHLLGQFATREEASAAYAVAACELHGEFARPVT